MSTLVGPCLTVLVLLAAQQPAEDRPAPAKPPARRDLDQREALKQYALGLVCQRENRLLEALRHFEEAARLDTEAAPVHKALIPLYLAVERTDDALAACRKTLELRPGDHETWFLRARLHHGLGQTKEASAALQRTLECPSIKERPDVLIRAAVELGTLREAGRDFEGALSAFDKAVEALDHPAALLEPGTPLTRRDIDAKAAELLERIGSICLQTRRYDRAREAFAKAQKKQPEMAGRLNFHLAKVCLAQSQPRDALRYLDEYLKTQPQSVEGYELQIDLLQQLGRRADVLPALKDHAERDAHNMALQLLLARRLAEESFATEAEERFKAIVQESPSPEAYRGLFNLYKEQGRERTAEVIALFDKALAEASQKDNAGSATAALRARAMLAVFRDDADLVKALLESAEEELNGRRRRIREKETWRYLAVLAARTRQLDAAERLYRRCLENLVPQAEAEVYVGYLRVLWEQRKLEEIVKVSRKGLKEAQATNRLLFHDHLARALIQLGKTDEALAEAEQALNLADDKNRLHFQLLRARILAMGDRFDKAVADCQALLKDTTQPDEIRDIRYTLSGIHSSARRLDKAEEQLRLILQADPNDDVANNDLGYLMADQGKNLEEAERLIRKAIQLDREQKKKGPRGGAGDDEDKGPRNRIGTDDDKDHAAYIDSLGWVLFRRGRIEEARKELEKAVALPDGGDDPAMWDHLGDVYLRLQEIDKARTVWQKALKLYEVDKRRKRDDQYKELQHKLQLLGR